MLYLRYVRIHLLSQIREYEELKMEASRQAARYLQELDSVNREQKADQDRLDNEMRRKGEVENKHRQKVDCQSVFYHYFKDSSMFIS